MSFAQRGADFLEGFNPFAEVERRAEQRKQERERQKREQQERERREREEYEARVTRLRLDEDAKRAAGQAQQTFQLTQQGADSELGRQIVLNKDNTDNAGTIIDKGTESYIKKTGADYKGQIGLTDADYQGKISVINNLLRGQKDSQTSKQDWVKEILDGHQAHERLVLDRTVGPEPLLPQLSNIYLTALDRTIAADERLQAAERPLRWAGLVLPTTAALAAALIK